MIKIGEFKLGNDVYKCCYVKDVVFIGVIWKCIVIIWDNGKMVIYVMCNFDGLVGVYVMGGRWIFFGMEGGMYYEFLVLGGIIYYVNIDVNGLKIGVSVIVC